MVFAPREPSARGYGAAYPRSERYMGHSLKTEERQRLFRTVYERRNPYSEHPRQPNTVGATFTHEAFGSATYVERNGLSRRENPPRPIFSRGSARFKCDNLFLKKQMRGQESPGVGKYYGNSHSSFHAKPLPPRPDPLLLRRYPGIPICNADWLHSTVKQRKQAFYRPKRSSTGASTARLGASYKTKRHPSSSSCSSSSSSNQLKRRRPYSARIPNPRALPVSFPIN